MRIYLLPGIPLSARTRRAWKNAASGIFTAQAMRRQCITRRRQLEWIHNEPVILVNLGSNYIEAELDDDQIISEEKDMHRIWNWPSSVKLLASPTKTRAYYNIEDPTLLAPDPTEQDHLEYPLYVWVKNPGRSGSNKEKVLVSSAYDLPELTCRPGDLQIHIDGIEFRVITITTTNNTPKVVQVQQRCEQPNTPRQYQWISVHDVPSQVRIVARRAAKLLPEGNTIVGWDVMYNKNLDNAYILEGNSCPGMSEPTAKRIHMYISAFLSLTAEVNTHATT